MIAEVVDLTVDIAVRQGRRAERVQVLDTVRLDVAAGSVTALVGESGCGKSMVAAALAGLLPPGSTVTGQVVVDGVAVGHDDERRWRTLRGSRIGTVPQSAATSFTPVRTLGSQLAEICSRVGADRTPAELCEIVALPVDTLTRYPHQLSGGMAQRAAIAAALAGRPVLLLADEPTSALDPDNAATVWRLLGQAAADGAAVLVITHDVPSLRRAAVCTDIAVMARGTIIERLPLADAINSPDDHVSALLS
ncbi:MAG: ATP-binding cassette domain-containing protein [Mycolicibacterium neoaurum]|uniref:ATP-binding cassette domain-containing protein n=1 Tax=Mycolicibacterium neoaurum TaxID=1795 RepID=UPI002FFBA673